jgi:signal peptide peptidase SppA
MFSLPAPIRSLLPQRFRKKEPVVPVVRLQGAIGMGTPLRPALTAHGTAALLEKAFSTKGAVEVAIVVNSPGGVPVQAHLIHKRIRALAAEKRLPVTCFVEDAAASGGYMIACAGDTIIADPASIVGSIGVVSAGFGFERLIEKIGVERRVHTAGTRKTLLDPFLPENPEDVERLKDIQRDVHRMFIDLVRTRRGDLLQGDDEALFTGEFWTGTRGLELGLVDGIGDLHGTLRARHGDEVRLRVIGSARNPFWRRLIAPHGTGLQGMAEDIMLSAEARALWSRLGL